MTNKQFQKMKADFLLTYKDHLCEDSVKYVNYASNLKEFLGILGEFIAHVGMKDLPTIEWARKWFKNELKELNECGVYLDQIEKIENTSMPFIFLFGDCKITFMSNKSCFYRILARDTSQVNFLLYGVGTTILRLHGNANHNVYFKDTLHRLKIHKI